MSKKRSPGFEKKRETRDDTAELATKKRSPGFSGKNRGVTPSVAAPFVTHPSDATDVGLLTLLCLCQQAVRLLYDMLLASAR